jgi:hypothetical protein
VTNEESHSPNPCIFVFSDSLRATKIKKAINKKYNSEIVEEKSYE